MSDSVTPWTVAHGAALSMGFPRQEYWSGSTFDQTHISLTGRWSLYHWASRETPNVIVAQSLSHVWLWPHGLQHARLPCPSLSPGVCSNLCPLSWWYHPTISSSASLFSFCPQSVPASGNCGCCSIWNLWSVSGRPRGELLLQPWVPKTVWRQNCLFLRGPQSMLLRHLSD